MDMVISFGNSEFRIPNSEFVGHQINAQWMQQFMNPGLCSGVERSNPSNLEIPGDLLACFPIPVGK